MGAKVLVGIDETNLLGPSVRVAVNDRAEEHELGGVACAVARKVHDGLGLAALAVEFEAVQVASLVDERHGAVERSGHILGATANEEGNVVDEGDLGCSPWAPCRATSAGRGSGRCRS